MRLRPFQASRVARWFVLLGLVLAALESTESNCAAATALTVSPSQRVTINATAVSRRELIEQLCAEAGIELRGYTIPDENVTLHVVDQPIARVLERLLRSHSYMLGVAAGNDGAQHVLWLRVGAPRPTTAADRAHGAPASGHVPVLGVAGVDPAAETTALTSNDSTKRATAAAQVARTLASNPNAREELLAKDLGATVEALAKFPYAVELVKEIERALSDDALARARMLALRRSLEIRRSGAK